MECGSSLLAISASFSPGFLRTHTPTTITDAVSQHPELFIIRDDSSLHRDSILLTMTFVLCRCPPSLNINLTEYIFNYTKLWVSNVAFVGLHAGLYNWKEVLFIYVIWSRRISHKKCRAKCLPKCLTKCLPNCLPNCLPSYAYGRIATHTITTQPLDICHVVAQPHI